MRFIDFEKLSYNSKLPRETEASYHKFLIYRDLPPHERSLTRAAEIISEDGSDVQTIRASLGHLSAKWLWVERCRLYDADRQLELARKREDKFNELNSIMLDNVDGLIRYANNLLGEVIKNPLKENGERYSLNSRIQMSNAVARLLKESNELVCKLTGRPHEYKELNVNADVSSETVNLFEKMKQKRKEL